MNDLLCIECLSESEDHADDCSIYLEEQGEACAADLRKQLNEADELIAEYKRMTLHFMAKDEKSLAIIDQLRSELVAGEHEIQQVLGKALGYPRYADDQENFPGATSDDVCMGEHTAITLAMEAAERLIEMKAAVEILDYIERRIADVAVRTANRRTIWTISTVDSRQYSGYARFRDAIDAAMEGEPNDSTRP